ncbi:MAG: hypothetical protein A2826_03135 [Candidatus Doudnabacteria bacterium RIFCSPHIGHO2_01_FULL_43_23]|uniref:Uncharacterized protein n=1 Tax=Candidatus Doudnabacteria bacterium RIFCSPHIGHO2_01_FULL_43_23 TaxID=1817822 RepID=A0A1F5NRR1_9BACT|nr:MAG: hypothetical protein A2826_03135 [Candidatus Doudnabacteria bacterium RIFCSPHIGHO2_01_FULL_43_23]
MTWQGIFVMVCGAIVGAGVFQIVASCDPILFKVSQRKDTLESDKLALMRLRKIEAIIGIILFFFGMAGFGLLAYLDLPKL